MINFLIFFSQLLMNVQNTWGTTACLRDISHMPKYCHKFCLLFYIFNFIVLISQSKPPTGPSLLVFPFFTFPIFNFYALFSLHLSHSCLFVSFFLSAFFSSVVNLNLISRQFKIFMFSVVNNRTYQHSFSQIYLTVKNNKIGGKKYCNVAKNGYFIILLVPPTRCILCTFMKMNSKQVIFQ